MAAQKLTKAQQKIIDALKAGATLGISPMSDNFYLHNGNVFQRVDSRSVRRLIDSKLVKKLPHISGRNHTYGLANTD